MRTSLASFHASLARPLGGRARLALALLVLPLVFAFSAPLWRISMEAPQYPAGLYLEVHAHKVEGGEGGQHLREINILNHYIGMRPLDASAFTDTRWIPFALIGLGLLVLRVAVLGDVRSLVDLAVMTLGVSAVAFGRFIYMLYTFGHVLDPRAPVKVKPFMPAVLGSKQVGNFLTHSWPALGSVFLGVFVTGLLVVLVLQLRQALRAQPVPARA